MSRPHDRAAAVVDLVGHPEAVLVRDVRNRRRERGRDTLKGVVVVVEDDYVPRRAEPRAGAAVNAFFRGGRHGRIVVASRIVSTLALDVAAVRARFSALQQPLAFFDGPGGTQ